MRGSFIPFFSLVSLLGCQGLAGPSGSSPSPGPSPGENPPEAEAPSAATREVGVLEAPVSFSVVAEPIPASPKMETLVAPFRARMGAEIQQVIGETTGILSKSLPEGTLGNFATDAMLWAANQRVSRPVEMALTNNGGLRVPLGPGPITVGQMYELMPFENRLSILVLSGSQVQELCDELAERRGEPIAGFSFRIEVEGGGRVAGDVRVGGAPLEAESEYRLVTNDYMADGGESLLPLQSPVAREDLPILLRDAFIEYLAYRGIIEPKLEGRVTGGIGR